MNNSETDLYDNFVGEFVNNTNSVANGASRSLTFDTAVPAYGTLQYSAYESSAFPAELHHPDEDYHGWFAGSGEGIIVQHEYTADVTSNTVGILNGDNQSMYTYVNQDAGSAVNLSFDFKNDPELSSQGAVQVIWQGKVIDTLYSQSDWQHKSYSLTASGGKDKLELQGMNLGHTTRNLIDNINVNSHISSTTDHHTDTTGVITPIVTPDVHNYHMPQSLDFENNYDQLLGNSEPLTVHQVTSIKGWDTSDSSIGLRFENYESGNQVGWLRHTPDNQQFHLSNTVNQAEGTHINLSFDTRGDDENAPHSTYTDGIMDVLWQGKVIDTIHGTEQWQHKSYDLVASGHEDKIEFRAESTGDKWSGTFIDNVVMSNETSPAENHYHLPQVLGFEDAGSIQGVIHDITKFDGWRTDMEDGLQNDVNVPFATGFENLISGNQVGDFSSSAVEGHVSNLYSTVCQAAGTHIDFSFDTRAATNWLPEATAHPNTLDILWQGKVIDTLTNFTDQWQHNEYHLQASGGEDRLEFRMVGDDRIRSTFVDNISVTTENHSGSVQDLSHTSAGSLAYVHDTNNISHAVVA